MTSLISVISRTLSAVLILLALATPSSHAFTHQIDYNDERGEYCYNESFNLGTCLGKQKADRLDLTDEQLLKCMECSGKFNGDESCDEIKALNDVELTSVVGDDVDVEDGGEGATINWHESFCETYNNCVETNCPAECRKQQDAWAQCLVIELDCDWRCPGSTTWAGGRSVGMGLEMENGATAVALGPAPRVMTVWGLVLLFGAVM